MTGFFGNVIPVSLEYIGVINLPSYLNPALTGAIISLITIICVSRIWAVTEQEAQYRDALHRTPDNDDDLKKPRPPCGLH